MQRIFTGNSRCHMLLSTVCSLCVCVCLKKRLREPEAWAPDISTLLGRKLASESCSVVVHDLGSQMNSQAKYRLHTENPHKYDFYPWSAIFVSLNFIIAINLLLKVALQCAVVTARPKLIPSSMDFRGHWWSSLQQGLHLSLLWALLDWPLPLRASQLQGQGQRATFPLACWRQVGSRMNKGCIRACCHLLAQWAPTASPGVNRSWNSGDRGLVSRGVGMTFWQGDKRHFFLSLTWWPGT